MPSAADGACGGGQQWTESAGEPREGACNYPETWSTKRVSKMETGMERRPSLVQGLDLNFHKSSRKSKVKVTEEKPLEVGTGGIIVTLHGPLWFLALSVGDGDLLPLNVIGCALHVIKKILSWLAQGEWIGWEKNPWEQRELSIQSEPAAEFPYLASWA